jgi:hypothetical protein
MNNMRLYTEGYKLQENEYLLKIRLSGTKSIPDAGFLTKLTQKGALPKSFIEWGNTWDYLKSIRTPMPEIQIHTEHFRQGWKLFGWRFGKSQNWASIITPEGWTIEVYLSHFLEIIKTHTVVNGELQGEFRWEDNRLIQKI